MTTIIGSGFGGMRRMWSSVVLLAVAGCAGTTEKTPTTTGDTREATDTKATASTGSDSTKPEVAVEDSGSPPACGIPDATASQCYSNRDLVVCGTLDGVHDICLATQPACSGSGGGNSIGGTTCSNLCGPDEFGQECLNTQNDELYPSGCHAPIDGGLFGGEAVYMCCNCKI